MKVEQAKALDEQGHRALALWAADCAERVLPLFEGKCPEDDRPRGAIEAGRAWARGEIAMGEARRRICRPRPSRRRLRRSHRRHGT